MPADEKTLRHTIAQRSGIGATGHITQLTHLGFTSITTDMPLMIIVRAGHKVIRGVGRTFHVDAGEAIAIAQGQVLDFENIPMPDGAYEARWLVFDPDVVETFGDSDGTIPVHPAKVLGRMSEGLSRAFEAAVAALQDGGELPDVVVRHRVMELLAWLNSAGLRFSRRQPDSFTARIRRMITKNPARDWLCPEISAALGLSEATLRRKLQQEGTSLRDIITDIRMTLAMQLLQSSQLPVSQVAASAGFESQSRFAIRFRHRFGFSPSAIRGGSKRTEHSQAG